MGKLHFKLLILTVILIAIFGVLFVVKSGKSQAPTSTYASEIVADPTIVPDSLTSIVAPDGKATLLVRERKVGSSNSWTFSIKDAKGEVSEIYQKTFPSGDGVSVPFNTFSPDDRYVFLKETVGGTDSFMVFKSSGESVSGDYQFYEIVSLFASKYPEYRITDVTGWAGPTLVVFNTDKIEGGVGPSFWFDVSSKSFIRLSNRFN